MATPLRTITAPDAPAPLGHYSHAVHAGDFLFLSGMVPFVPGLNDIVDGAIREQTQQVLDNISQVLKHEGLSLSDVTKATVYLHSMEDFGDMQEVYAENFGDHKPARSTIAAHLPRNVLVEIDVIAYHPKKD